MTTKSKRDPLRAECRAEVYGKTCRYCKGAIPVGQPYIAYLDGKLPYGPPRLHPACEASWLELSKTGEPNE